MKKLKYEFMSDVEFMNLCEKGDLQTIKQLLTVYNETDISSGNNHGLTLAARNNHLNVVKYLLEKTTIGQDPRIYDEHCAYAIASSRGNLEVTQCLFQHWIDNEVLQKSKPEMWEYGFTGAYSYENAKAIKFYIENPVMKPYANINIDNDSCFINLYKKDRQDLLQMLIFDLNIEMTEEIKNFLDKPGKRDRFCNDYEINPQHIFKMFETRDLENKLENLYPESNMKTKTYKI